MSASPSTREPLCFTCGLPVGEPLRLNHLPNGQSCPACRDRLLEALPAPFSSRGPRQGTTVEAQEEQEVDEAQLAAPPALKPVRARRRRERGPEPA